MIQRTSRGSVAFELAAGMLLIAAVGFTVYAIQHSDTVPATIISTN